MWLDNHEVTTRAYAAFYMAEESIKIGFIIKLIEFICPCLQQILKVEWIVEKLVQLLLKIQINGQEEKDIQNKWRVTYFREKG